MSFKDRILKIFQCFYTWVYSITHSVLLLPICMKLSYKINVRQLKHTPAQTTQVHKLKTELFTNFSKMQQNAFNLNLAQADKGWKNAPNGKAEHFIGCKLSL